ncbi:hypothetical protein [Streptomyces malaysiensis]|uniref:hypothetical protein n=1 Tax=Streptomyces malaysiensis TaxID=92644 RepID=UPI002B2E6D0A|nr:hypothetical protein R8789_29710 [Streptomyces malaysiensis]
MEPLTEHRRVNGPVVYGFLRLVNVPEARQIALIASLAEYCRRHELLLSGVFTDRKATAGPITPAFTGLLDVLTLPGTYGVVLPAVSHLGPKGIATERESRIDAAVARMLLVRGTRKPRQAGHGRSNLPSTGHSYRRSPGPAPALDAET